MRLMTSATELISAVMAAVCLHAVAHTATDAVARQNSIDQYNAGKMKFERFWNTYHDSAVYKIFLKYKDVGSVRTTLDQAMDFIRATHDYSGGMHQIVYLVGWQHDGHDSKFPSWGKVGDQCRSSFSQDPRESLRAMMREARKFNADVSLSPVISPQRARSTCVLTEPKKCLPRAGPSEFQYVRLLAARPISPMFLSVCVRRPAIRVASRKNLSRAAWYATAPCFRP